MRFIEYLIDNGLIRESEKYNIIVILLRLLAIPLIKISLIFKIHPNIITFFGFGCGLYGVYAFSNNMSLIFLIFWSLSCVIDYADGVIARIAKKESHFGYLFDMVTDRIRLMYLLTICIYIFDQLSILLLSISAILFLLSCDIILHTFLPKNKNNSTMNYDQNTSLPFEVYKTIFYVHMHSFFIFGFLVYLGGDILFYGLIWLNIILFIDLKKAFLNNIFYDNRLNFNFNKNLLKKLNNFFIKIKN